MRSLSYFLFFSIILVVSCNSNEEKDEAVETENSVIEDSHSHKDEADIVSDDFEEDTQPGDMDNSSETEIEEEVVQTKIDEPAKSNNAPKTVSKFSFINGKYGLDVGEEVEFNLSSYAAEDVSIRREGTCQDDCGKMVYAENYNEQNKIQVVIHIKWKSEGEKLDKLRVYELKPNEKIHIGCTLDCANDNSVKWKIVSAEYID